MSNDEILDQAPESIGIALCCQVQEFHTVLWIQFIFDVLETNWNQVGDLQQDSPFQYLQHIIFVQIDESGVAKTNQWNQGLQIANLNPERFPTVVHFFA